MIDLKTNLPPTANSGGIYSGHSGSISSQKTLMQRPTLAFCSQLQLIV